MKYNKNSYTSREDENGTEKAWTGGVSGESNGSADSGAGADSGIGADYDGSGSRADELQAAVYREGMRVLNVLSQRNPEEKEVTDACGQTQKALDELGHFYYNIGFAGEQSCGKSTVINSLLQYPLMPTCNITTTCTVVKLVYSDKIRVIATDDDTGKRIFDLDCADISRDKFNKLKEYACLAMPVMVIENINYFTEKNIFEINQEWTPDDIEMDRDNPREVALLALILLSTYIGQNDPEMTEEKQKIIKKREAFMKYFGIPEETVNYSVLVQWDSDLLKSGLVITDLPGLGAFAEKKEVHGKILKGHDDITKEAIQESDSMAFIEEDTVKNLGTAALKEMLSSARLKELVNKGERVIPVLNKADRLEEAQLASSRQKFAELLLGANVRKRSEDIIPYSAIYGEYAYQDIIFKRALYFKNDKAKPTWALGRKMHMSDNAILEELTSGLKESYEKSGIEELKDFFRTTYVERGKYNKAIAAVYAVRNLAIQMIAPMENQAKAYKILGDATQEAVSDITGALKDAAMEPINFYTGELQERIEQVRVQTQPVVEAMLEAETSLYQKAFERALEQYKNRLLEIVGGFDLTWGGFGSKAQIDVVGSGNQRTYQKLMGEMERFPVDVAEVNGQYEKVLGYVDSQIDQIYKKAIGGLEKLKDGLEKSVGKSIETAKAKSQTSDAVVLAMVDMGGALLKFVDKQLLAMSQNLDIQRAGIADAGNAVVSEVMTQNTEMAGSFTGAIKGSMKDFIKSGILLSKRDYLIIDGTDGLKEKIKTLSLTREEKENMEINIRVVGSREIVAKLNQWMDGAGEIIDIYTNLSVQIKQLMDDTAAKLSGTAGDNRAAYEALLAEISALQMEFYAFKEAVQEQFDAALVYFHETEPNIVRMRGNVLVDV